jgi:hypothetical protein
MTPQTPQLPLHIDSTMITCARSCLQKFLLEFVHGYRPRAISVDLHAGACFATGLETVYRGIWEQNLSLPSALERAHAAFHIAWGDFEIPAFKKTAKTADRIWEAIESYFEQYPPRTDHVQPYFGSDGKPTFEYTFAIPLEPANNFEGENFPLHPSGAPFIYSGRFDMLGAISGRPCVRDEKTTGGSISTNWSDQWNLRSQFLGYVWACQQAGINLDTVVVRGIAIQKTQIVHAEDIKNYSAHLVAKWHEQLRRDLWRIRRAWDEGYFDFNLGDACTSYGNCVFQSACASTTPEAWLSDFVVKHWNPLDKNPAKEPTT